MLSARYKRRENINVLVAAILKLELAIMLINLRKRLYDIYGGGSPNIAHGVHSFLLINRIM